MPRKKPNRTIARILGLLAFIATGGGADRIDGHQTRKLLQDGNPSHLRRAFRDQPD